MTALLVISCLLVAWDAMANTAYYLIGKKLTRAMLAVAKELEQKRKAAAQVLKP